MPPTGQDIWFSMFRKPLGNMFTLGFHVKESKVCGLLQFY